MMPPPRPADVCRGLLSVLASSEDRRQRRRRDTTPDTIGLALKRQLLQRAVEDDPAPEAFEAWLLEQCTAIAGAGAGGVRAMAIEILAEWRLAATSAEFRDWLQAGAPAGDRTPG